MGGPWKRVLIISVLQPARERGSSARAGSRQDPVPEASPPPSPFPPLNKEESGLEAEAEGSAPVVGSAGLIHLQKSVVLVSRVVGGHDVHFIPVLRLFLFCTGGFTHQSGAAIF